MPTRRTAIKLTLSLCITTILTAWASQNSINAYWQQTYHSESPLTTLNKYPLWQAGSAFQTKVTDQYHRLITQLFSSDTAPETILNQTPPLPLTTPDTHQETITNTTTTFSTKTSPIIEPQTPETDTAIPITTVEPNDLTTEIATDDTNITSDIANTPPESVTLQHGDHVLFVGDSLMKSVAPHIQRWLKEQYNITSSNLSKPSTGLAYPAFFDWPATIEKHLKEDPNIRLMIVMMGTNDAWDFPNPTKEGAFFKFKSEDWVSTYHRRIMRILQAAETTNTAVIWIGLPTMKSPKFDGKMRYVDGFMRATTFNRVIWIPTMPILDNEQGQYADSIIHNGKLTRMRKKDGIHFSTIGELAIAQAVKDKIQYQSSDTLSSPTPP